MATQPIILALANPTPEILPELAQARCGPTRSSPPAVRTIRTRSTTRCVSRTSSAARSMSARPTINEAMKVACVHAIAELARREMSDIAARAYGDQLFAFGPEYLIPQPFDPRLLVSLAPAVAQAAMDSGVATRPIADMDGLSRAPEPVRLPHRPGDEAGVRARQGRPQARRLRRRRGRHDPARGADLVDEGLARPILIGRPAVIERRIAAPGLRIRAGEHFELMQRRRRSALQRVLEPVPQARPSAAASRRRWPRRWCARGRRLIAALMVDARRSRRDDLRHRRPLYAPAASYPRRAAAGSRRVRAVGDDRGAERPRHLVLRRHARADTIRPPSRSPRRRAGRAAPEAVRHHAEGGAAVAFEFRQPRQPERGARCGSVLELVRTQQARSSRSTARCRPTAALERGNPRRASSRTRCCAASANVFVFPNLDAANIAYNMVRADDRRRRDRPDPDGRVQARARAHAGLDGAPRRQHDARSPGVEAQIRGPRTAIAVVSEDCHCACTTDGTRRC